MVKKISCVLVLVGVLFLMGSNDDIRGLFDRGMLDKSRKADMTVTVNHEPLSLYHDVDMRLEHPHFGPTPIPCECGGMKKVDEVKSAERYNSTEDIKFMVVELCTAGREGFVDIFEDEARNVYYVCDSCKEGFWFMAGINGYGRLVKCEEDVEEVR